MLAEGETLEEREALLHLVGEGEALPDREEEGHLLGV